jgi:transposase
MNVAGIDTGYKILDVVVRKKGKSLRCRSFSNTPSGHSELLSYLRKHKVKRVGIEATGYYHLDVATELDYAPDIDVMVINPRASKNFAKALMVSIKNDAIDAEIIAQFIERMDFVPWNAPDYDVFALRACGRRLITLSKEKTKAKNQLHAASTTRQTPQFILDDILLTITQLEDQIANLIDNALEVIGQNSHLASQHKLLIGMKGVANKTAIKLLGELGVLDENMVGKQWVSHAGLFPREFQSGSSVNKRTTIGKTGNRYIREALYMAALSASRHDPHIRGFYRHLVEDNGKAKLQAVCAVMRKMLLSMHAMLKNDKPFDGSRFYALNH